MSFPVGRSRLAPAIVAPFQHPPQIVVVTNRKGPAVMEMVKKVHGWAEELRSGKVAGLTEISRRERISVARVCQLLPLAKVPTAAIAEHAGQLRRLSLRALIRFARRWQ